MRAGELACGEINILEEKNMEKFIGTKIVEARPDYKVTVSKPGCMEQTVIQVKENPIDGTEYAAANGWTVGDKQDGYEVVYEGGYRSWSPKEVFEAAYRRTDGMNFGLAIEAAKMGKRIARRGWNGKGMWVVYRTGYPDGIPANKNTADAVGIKEGELFKVRPYLQMKCADGSFQMWLASQSDILEDDWYIVE